MKESKGIRNHISLLSVRELPDQFYFGGIYKFSDCCFLFEINC